MRRAVTLLALVAGLAWAAPAGAACETMVAMGERREQGGDDDGAIRVYSEAVGLDAQCAPAWLRLAELRLKRGDALEAKRVIAAARGHLADLAEASPILARARWALGERAEAEGELDAWASAAASPAEQGRALRQLAAWYADDRNVPAQLGVWRRLLVLAERGGDAAGAKDARTTVRALVLLAGALDPATAPPAPASGVRRAIAAAAKKL